MSTPDLPRLLALDEPLSIITTPVSGLLVRNGPHLVVSGDEHVCGATVAEAEHDDDDDEDGFKTPTSSEHKIPVLTECPPAPAPKRLEKPTTPGGSRKRRRLTLSLRLEEVEVIDLPYEEVESSFQLQSLAEEGDKMKKRARIDGDDGDGNPCS